MKENEKRMIIGLICIVAIIFVVIIFMKIGKNEESIDKENKLSQTETNKINEEFAKEQEDGTKKNTSDKLAQTKKIDGLEISNFQLKENGDTSQIIADIKNTSQDIRGGYEIKLIFVDKDGKTIEELSAYIDKVEAGKTTQLNSSGSSKLANAYDLKIEK